MVGWPVTAKTVPAHKDDPMQFWSFEDETALYETVLFPEAYNRYHSSIDRLTPYIVTGNVENDHGALSLSVQTGGEGIKGERLEIEARCLIFDEHGLDGVIVIAR